MYFFLLAVDVELYVSGAEEQLQQRLRDEEAQRLAAQAQRTAAQEQQAHNSLATSATGSASQQPTGVPDESTYINYEDEDFVDDANFESAHVAPASAVGENRSLSAGYASMSASSAHRIYPQPCVALYDFKVALPKLDSF